MRTVPLMTSCAAAALVSMFATTASQAAELRASSCSQSAVQSAINAAADGDVVVIPSGSCTWTAPVQISGKGIHLKGEQKGAVQITHSAGSSNLLSVTTDARRSVEVSNLTFLPGSVSGSADYVAVYGSGRPALVHDNYFRTSAFKANCMRWFAKGGVIYRNVFESLDRDGSSGGCLRLKPASVDATSWSTDSTMGQDDVAGTANIYVEENSFHKILVQAIDVDDDMRAVIRHNTFDNSGFVYHGPDTSLTGARHVEVYNNKFVFTTSGSNYNFPLALNWWVYVRGGTGVWLDNEMPDITSQMWGNKPEIVLTVQNLRRNAGPYSCWKTYPAPHQVGQSHNGSQAVTEPMHIWNNTGGGAQTPSLNDYSPDECGGGPAVSTFIQAGREYVVGTAKPGYVKYTYPHPLRGGSSAVAVSPPMNLVVR